MRALLLILLVSYSFSSCISHATKRESIPVAAVKYADPYIMIKEGQALLKEGDMVVRLNQDPASQFIKNFNRQDKSYSHAGVVLFEKGYPFIYHIVNGEENPEEKLKKDSLSRFCDPRKNLSYGIYRYELGEGEIKRLKALIYKWHAKGVQFDYQFNLKTDDKMYCSEMIRKALEKVTNKRILIETTDLTPAEAGLFSAYMHLPLTYTSQLKIISIDNLYKTPSCKLIKDYNYKNNR
jgi:hypothetical protein